MSVENANEKQSKTFFKFNDLPESFIPKVFLVAMSGSLRTKLFSPDGLDQTYWDMAAFASRVGQEMSDARSEAITKSVLSKVQILLELLSPTK